MLHPKNLALLAAALVGVRLDGCHEPEPSYPAAIVRFDDGAAGRWRFQLDPEDKAIVEVTITPRTMEIADGRVLPEPTDGAREAGRAFDSTTAFTGLITVDAPGEAGAFEHAELEVKGFMLEVDGERFITYQPSAAQMNKAHLGGMVLPIQQVVKVVREGETVTIRAPKVPLGWLPDAIWLDAPRAPLAAPDVGDWSNETRRVTLDIDRFVEALRKYAKADGFWGEPTILHKVE